MCELLPKHEQLPELPNVKLVKVTHDKSLTGHTCVLKCLDVASQPQILNYWHFFLGHRATNDFYIQNALEIA